MKKTRPSSSSRAQFSAASTRPHSHRAHFYFVSCIISYPSIASRVLYELRRLLYLTLLPRRARPESRQVEAKVQGRNLAALYLIPVKHVICAGGLCGKCAAAARTARTATAAPAAAVAGATAAPGTAKCAGTSTATTALSVVVSQGAAGLFKQFDPPATPGTFEPKELGHADAEHAVPTNATSADALGASGGYRCHSSGATGTTFKYECSALRYAGQGEGWIADAATACAAPCRARAAAAGAVTTTAQCTAEPDFCSAAGGTGQIAHTNGSADWKYLSTPVAERQAR